MLSHGKAPAGFDFGEDLFASLPCVYEAIRQLIQRSSKPVSRVLYPSSTGRTVAIYLALPFPEGSCGQPGDRPGVLISLYSALLRMGFTQPTGHPVAGGLLPHHFTLTLPVWEGRYVSVALSIGSPLLGITQHPARWSSDFPPLPKEGRPPGLLDPLIV